MDRVGRALRVLAFLARPIATREARRTSATMLVVLLAYLGQYHRALKVHPIPEGDGFYSWMFATSLAFDGDLELTNDYTLCDRVGAIVDEGGGRPSNPFYFGPAVVWTPLLSLARLLVRLPAGASDALRHGCIGPYPRFVGWTAPFFTTLTIWLAYRVARRWVTQPYALAGALVGAFGTTLVTYGGPFWFYSHMWSALGVALVVLAFVRATERPSAPRWALFGLSVAFSALMRPQEGVWILLGVPWLVAEIRARGVGRDVARRLLVPPLAWTLGFASLFWIQLLVYKKLYGVYWLVPQGKLWLQLRHPHPILMLFSGYSGWFTWTPLVWLGVIGMGQMVWRRATRVLGVGLVLCSCLEIYISSSALAWTGSGTWGQRMLTSLAPVVALGAAFSGRAFGEWVRRRVARTRFVLVVAATFPLMFMTWGTPFVSASKVQGSAVYGAAVARNFENVNNAVGNPFTLPATAAFALRYGLPPAKFDDLAYTGHFVRDYRTAAPVGYETLDFAQPPTWSAYAEGVELEKSGARVRSGHGRFLLSLYWPWVTHVRLTVDNHAPRPVTLRLRASGPLVGTELGSMEYPPGVSRRHWSLPAAGLTSGINEIFVDADGDVTLQSLELIDRMPHDLSVH